MGRKTLEETLKTFGLTDREAEIYIYLAKRGAQKVSEIAKALKANKGLVFRILKNLEKKGLVEGTLESPTRYVVFPFERIIDNYIQSKREEAALIENAKHDLLSEWKEINKNEHIPSLERFLVIEDEKKIFKKISQMVKETQEELVSITSINGLLKAEKYDILDAIINHPSSSKIKFRYLTTVNKENISSIKFLLGKIDSILSLKGKHPFLQTNVFPRLVIRDKEEILLFIDDKTKTDSRNSEYTALCTNCRSILQSYYGFFEDLWSKSLDLDDIIQEIENGESPAIMDLINDPKIAKQIYQDTLHTAKKEILLVTSSKGLLQIEKDINFVKNLFEKGVLTKIMAPITRENIDAARSLSNYCQIKHASATYVETTIVDKQQLFQFSSGNNQRTNKFPNDEKFRRTFYTTNSERVQKSLNMLQNIWNNSCNPSILSLNDLFGQSNQDEYKFKFNHKIHNIKILPNKAKKRLTEKDVLDKIINADGKKGSSKNIIGCSTMGFALIHPPSYLKLPNNTLIGAIHINKKSSLGAEDAIMVYFWQKTSDGFKYVPVALFADNPKGMIAQNNQTRGTPAETNRHLVEKDQINIQVHGNTLFAEWKMPITIMNNKYTLPSAAILLESYGKIRTHSYSTMYPNKIKTNWAINSFEAFVTFMHKNSKYTGPGTDGLLLRDAFLEMITP